MFTSASCDWPAAITVGIQLKLLKLPVAFNAHSGAVPGWAPGGFKSLEVAKQDGHLHDSDRHWLPQAAALSRPR